MKVKTKCLKKLQKRRLFINTVQLKSATKIVRRVAPPSCNKSFCLLTRLANKTFVADFNASFENAMTIRKGFLLLRREGEKLKIEEHRTFRLCKGAMKKVTLL